MDWHLKLFQLTSPELLLEEAERFLAGGNQHGAASALDRAYGIDTGNQKVAEQRQKLMNGLARRIDGIDYRYIPGGYFMMGSKHGDPDERPVHRVRLQPFWMAEAPVDWVWLCRVMGYSPPPRGLPEKPEFSDGFVWEIRQQYCEDHTERASDWHNHYYEAVGESGWPYQPDRQPLHHGYKTKPVVGVHYPEAKLFCQKSSTRLPTEAEWEKAARGGLIGQTYSWGSQPPDPERCDFGQFEQFNISPSRQFPPNGYGLYSMCGGVWEWTSSFYDSRSYRLRCPIGLGRLRRSGHG